MSSNIAAIPAVRDRSSWPFYLGIGLALVTAVLVGFGRTIDAGLLHPPSPRPWILYVHVTLFSTWLVVFITQVTLVGTRRMRWHRRVGYASVGLGFGMVIVGVMTAIAMTRLHVTEGSDGAVDMIVPFFDMVAFTVLFALAIIWRFRPDYHRRLILMASCGLTAAAFGRFPHTLVPAQCWYIAVDVLIFAGVIRDLVTLRRVHPVYLVGLPALALGQAATMWIALSAPQWWLTLAHAIV